MNARTLLRAGSLTSPRCRGSSTDYKSVGIQLIGSAGRGCGRGLLSRWGF